MSHESRQSSCIQARGGALDAGSTHLCRNDDIIALPSEFLDGLAHDDFRLAFGVDLGRVEEVDTTIIRRLHAVQGPLCKSVIVSNKALAGGKGFSTNSAGGG